MRGRLAVASLAVVVSSCGSGAGSDQPAVVEVIATGLGTPTAIVASGGSIYWIDTEEGAIIASPGAGGVVEVLAAGQDAPSSLALDATSVYWSDAGEGCVSTESCPGAAIMKAPRGGGALVTLSAAVQPTAIAIDAVNAYWIDSVGYEQVVAAVPLAGGAATILGGGQPGAAAITVEDPYVYWTVDGDGGAVLRGLVTGGTMSELPGVQERAGAIVARGGSVYWLDGAGPEGTDQISVFTAPLGGFPVIRLAVSPAGDDYATPLVAGLAVDDVNVYWTVTGDPGMILSVPLGGGAVATVAIADTRGGGLAVDGGRLYWTGGDAVFGTSL